MRQSKLLTIVVVRQLRYVAVGFVMFRSVLLWQFGKGEARQIVVGSVMAS